MQILDHKESRRGGSQFAEERGGDRMRLRAGRNERGGLPARRLGYVQQRGERLRRDHGVASAPQDARALPAVGA